MVPWVGRRSPAYPIQPAQTLLPSEFGQLLIPYLPDASRVHMLRALAGSNKNGVPRDAVFTGIFADLGLLRLLPAA